ncbi:MAG: hypothetical protein K0R70_679 [Steroidobacteraceae bacterium]|nr:hypothetical protein [Steroidobacteraceae bacterium]
MKTWIGRMNQMAAGMLFNGGYIADPARGPVDQPVTFVADARREPAAPATAGGRIDTANQRGCSAAKLATN